VSRTPRSYFDRLYAAGDDPWGFESRWYEQRKYALTVASLPRPRYRSAFEPGCSIGVLTAVLADRCDRLLAVDQVPAAVDAARRRLAAAGAAGVEVALATVPSDWPAGPFDLLVLSEVAYYFDEPELRELLAVALGSLADDADVVAVHWRGETDYPLSGDEAHRVIADTAGLRSRTHLCDGAFVLDTWELRR
jgi:SAM-dependent methyltransferase